jgi:hypothetical protein
MSDFRVEEVKYKIKRAPRGSKKPRQRKKRKKMVKDKVWRLNKADGHFSKFIRERDGKCMHPIGCSRQTMLQNSHYFGRSIKSTRFDPDNCITLCWLHHYKDKLLGFEFQKQTVEEHGYDGGYTLFMKQHLGEERWLALRQRASQTIKQKEAIIAYQKTLEQ